MRSENMATQSIYFSKFKLLNNYSIDEIVELLNNTVDISERFVVNDYSNDYIDGMYIMSYVSKELIFNVDTMNYENIEVRKNIAISFSIDISRDIIEIWGNKSNAQKLLVRLSILFNNKIITDGISIKIPDVIKRLKQYRIIIGKVKIEDIVLQDNLIASCVFDLTNHEKPYDILNKYKEKLTQVSVILKEENSTSITVSIYSSGSIIVYRNRENISESTLMIIKQICIGGFSNNG